MLRISFYFNFRSCTVRTAFYLSSHVILVTFFRIVFPSLSNRDFQILKNALNDPNKLQNEIQTLYERVDRFTNKIRSNNERRRSTSGAERSKKSTNVLSTPKTFVEVVERKQNGPESFPKASRMPPTYLVRKSRAVMCDSSICQGFQGVKKFSFFFLNTNLYINQ